MSWDENIAKSIIRGYKWEVAAKTGKYPPIGFNGETDISELMASDDVRTQLGLTDQDSKREWYLFLRGVMMDVTPEQAEALHGAHDWLYERFSRSSLWPGDFKKAWPHLA